MSRPLFPIIPSANIYDANGNLIVSGDILPSANDQFNLGVTGAQWKNLHVGANTIWVDGVPISSTNNTIVLPVGTTIGEMTPGSILINGSLASSNDLVNVRTPFNSGTSYIIGNNLWVGITGVTGRSPLPTDWQNIGPIVGPQGTQGPAGSGGGGGGAGSAGPQGAQGFQGADGAQGNQGFQGSNGSNGSNGAQGNQGSNGSNGTNGTNGSNGAQGNQGFQGANGSNGAQGNQGNQGFQGTNGSNGAQGNQGNQGFQGTNGSNGAQGNQGFQGTNGTNGSNGAQGNQGNQGFQGTNGSNGAQGNQGFQGTNGTNGSNGAQGNQGNQGFQGTNGSNGAQGNQGFQGTNGSNGAQGNQGNQGFQGTNGSNGAQGNQGTQGAVGPTPNAGITFASYLYWGFTGSAYQWIADARDVRIGTNAGATAVLNANQYVAIGHQAGATGISDNAIAIGAFAGASGLGARSIAIGFRAGSTGMRNDSIAIGTRAGQTGSISASVGYIAHSFIGFESNGNGLTGYTGVTGYTIVLGSTATDVFIGRNAYANKFYATSDYRIKQNVENLGHSYSLENLRPVSYFNTHTKTKDCGFIAHELQAEIPELVTGQKDGQTLQTINYNGLIPILTKEVNEQKKLIEQMLQRITQLEQALQHKY